MNEKQPPPTPELPHDYYEDEIDLVDIFSVLWRQRWFIAGVTMFFVALAVIYVFVKTPLYEITAQISPGITDIDEDGNTVRKVSSDDIIAWFSEEAYADLFDKNINRLPKITAKNVPKTNMVKIIYFHKNSSEGENILNKIVSSLIRGEANDFSRELNVRKNIINQKIIAETQKISMLTLDLNTLKLVDEMKIDNEIENANVEIKMLNKKNQTIRKNITDALNTLEKTKNEIDRVNQNTEEIMLHRKQMVSEESDKIALLMYSNIIQQNISFTNILQNQRLALKIEINIFIDQENENTKQIDYLNTQIRDLNLDRDESLVLRDKDINLQIDSIKSVIETLKTKISNLSTIEIIKAPVSSNQPVKPDKLKIVMLSFIIGIFLAVLFSFLRNFWINNKVRIKEKACK